MTLAYSVVEAFKARSAISGRERQFKPGETLLSEAKKSGPTVTIEFDHSFFVIDRSVFEACCVFKNEGAGF
jgi:hypothetical protein